MNFHLNVSFERTFGLPTNNLLIYPKIQWDLFENLTSIHVTFLHWRLQIQSVNFVYICVCMCVCLSSAQNIFTMEIHKQTSEWVLLMCPPTPWEWNVVIHRKNYYYAFSYHRKCNERFINCAYHKWNVVYVCQQVKMQFHLISTSK